MIGMNRECNCRPLPGLMGERNAIFMKRLLIWLGLGFLAATGSLNAEERLNVVFILADDLGWTDLGCQGSKYYETPNIDRLAAEGVRFQNYHHCQNCQPTRAALMSGQYGARTGVYTVGGIGRFDWQSRPLRPVDNVQQLPLDRVTVAQALKAGGYATAMFGKWHLGEKSGYHPSERGFDEAVVSMGKHFDFETNPKVRVRAGEYLADFLTDRAEDFIRRHREKPFFLYLPHFGVHSPYEAKAGWVEHFKGKPGVGGHRDPVYAAMIASVDESVGRILGLLEELKLAEKTVVVFSSDNGGVGGYSRPGGMITEPAHPKIKEHSATDNAPLRSGKGSLYEGGTRVPLIVRWPGVTPKGGVSDQAAIHVDLYPTFLEITGVTPPAGYVLDGKSLSPVLRAPASKLARPAIFQHFPGYLGSGPGLWRTTPVGVIQAGDWKLMEFYEDNHLELYNLADDIGESRNLASEHPDKASELKEQLVAWRASVQAKMPTPNTDQKESGASGGKRGGKPGRQEAGKAAEKGRQKDGKEAE
jgi:arylsulfatase A-like enzyme